LASSNGDDRLLGIYVFFTREDEGDDADLDGNGNYLAYVWGGKTKVGSVFASADKKGKTIVIRAHSAAQKIWAKAEASYISDFRREFGYNGYPAFVAISADSDDSHGQTIAAIKNIEFSNQP
jgi:hypothetical protein